MLKEATLGRKIRASRPTANVRWTTEPQVRNDESRTRRLRKWTWDGAINYNEKFKLRCLFGSHHAKNKQEAAALRSTSFLSDSHNPQCESHLVLCAPFTRIFAIAGNVGGVWRVYGLLFVPVVVNMADHPIACVKSFICRPDRCVLFVFIPGS
jgi:hypothetical protein